ncbi:M20 family metallo-hydrolase [Alteribacillus bidgolensis]|uniref:N-carbamoyl-L-amino-acid hydrolase n=1 Tax=Alteribacillus bidgolensis TaxID=930129 RepID=A0A1G8H651_9BACI|nr:M20 family metallo-hydrolase [Alteribacillus bidgolensis]SDI02093.1 N-carbamoyl-L-amino-acid hydrolase [Alteribacillus bidgolensis]
MPINSRRLKHIFSDLSYIGEESDGSITRLALTDEDKSARDRFIQLLCEHDLSVRVDDFGNIYGRLEGKNPSSPPIVIGSHLDTVRHGGLYDGTVGVTAGLEILIALKEEQWKPDIPIEVVSFTNEEGARFPHPMLGSSALVNAAPEKTIREMKDSEGFTFQQELERIGYDGERNARLNRVHMYCEIHIEQGPLLEKSNKPIGIIKGIQGLSWHKVIFKGRSDHAASTPYHDRQDPMRATVHTMEKLYEKAEQQLTTGTFTIGKVEVQPNISNVIAKEVTTFLDIRNQDKKALQKDVDTIRSVIHDCNTSENVEIQDLAFQHPVTFSSRLLEELENICGQSGIETETMFSGAGHDAIYMPRLGETIMMFVPSKDGISHSKEEYSDWKDIYQSAEILYELVKKESSLSKSSTFMKEANK